MDNTNTNDKNESEVENKGTRLIAKAKELDLEPKVISLAEKAAANGHFDESIGLLDNLLHLQPSNKKKITSLTLKYMKEKEKKENLKTK